METSLRYGGDSKSLRIHAKESLSLDSQTHLQVHGELDTRVGSPSHFSALLRRFFPDLSASLGVGVQYNKREKLRYVVRGKKSFPVTTNGQLSFNIKGRCDIDKELKQRTSKGAAELSWAILNFQKDQDVRIKIGYQVIEQVPYFQFRENNWTFNVDRNGRWNVRFDLQKQGVHVLPRLKQVLVEEESGFCPWTITVLISAAAESWFPPWSLIITLLPAVPVVVFFGYCLLKICRVWFRPSPNKALKKKILRSLPKLSLTVQLLPIFAASECAICLGHFAVGDEIRELPPCGHPYHVECIDLWLGSHSFCPYCRQMLVVSRCLICTGGFPAKERDHDHMINESLP